MRRINVISIIEIIIDDDDLDQKSCILSVHEIAKKITVVEYLHLANAWSVECYQRNHNMQLPISHGEFIISPKEVESSIERPTDLSTELYDEWMNVNEEVSTTEVVT